MKNESRHFVFLSSDTAMKFDVYNNAMNAHAKMPNSILVEGLSSGTYLIHTKLLTTPCPVMNYNEVVLTIKALKGI